MRFLLEFFHLSPNFYLNPQSKINLLGQSFINLDLHHLMMIFIVSFHTFSKLFVPFLSSLYEVAPFLIPYFRQMTL
jgi:hypothetical protein